MHQTLPAGDQFTTISGAVTLLAQLGCPVSAGTVRVWSDAGRLPTVRTDAGVRLFRRSDVALLAAERRRQPVPAA